MVDLRAFFLDKMTIFSTLFVILLLVVTPPVQHAETFEDIEQIYDQIRNDAQSQPRYKRERPNIQDKSRNSWEVETEDIPRHSGRPWEVNHRYMPVLSNGFLATTIYNFTIFMQGLYAKRYSDNDTTIHRARLPGKTLFRVNFTTREEWNYQRYYRYNIDEGFFQEQIAAIFGDIYHTTYLHHHYQNVIVSHLGIKRKRDGSTGRVILQKNQEANMTEDLNVYQINEIDQGWRMHADVFQERGTKRNVYIFYQPVPAELLVQGATLEINNTYIMAVDVDENRARTNFEDAHKLLNTPRGPGETSGQQELFERHTRSWKEYMSRHGRIEISGNNDLNKVVRFAMYSLIMSLPIEEKFNLDDPFVGLSRSSLGKGSGGVDYQGHVFWDNEMYIMPALLPFSPDLARLLIGYRTEADRIQAAKSMAGGKGYRFPWESAYTGYDVTPESCTACRDNQLHVTAGVSFAARQYWSMTHDEIFMKDSKYNGCELTKQIAHFWYDKARWNNTKRRYDINGVMGPDDYHPLVNNNAYTNAAASLAIHWGRYFACMCSRPDQGREDIPDDMINTAIWLYLSYDETRKYHYQYEGQEKETNKTIKQADATLLSFPLLWNMSTDIVRNDLEFHQSNLDENTPAMTWAFHTVSWVMVNDLVRADEAFEQTQNRYLVRPFHVWTERREDTVADEQNGAVNYLPAAGGLIQSIVYGYAGIHIRPEELQFHRPAPPPGADSIKFVGFRYVGANMTIEILTGDRVNIEVHQVNIEGLKIRRNYTRKRAPVAGDEFILEQGQTYTMENTQEGFFMFSLATRTCELPKDYIHTSYAWWVSAAPRISSELTQFFTSCVILLLFLYK